MMAALRQDDGFAGRGDDVYAALVGAHAGLGEAESLALLARLVLLLAHEVGDVARVEAAIAAARNGLETAPQSSR